MAAFQDMVFGFLHRIIIRENLAGGIEIIGIPFVFSRHDIKYLAASYGLIVYEPLKIYLSSGSATNGLGKNILDEKLLPGFDDVFRAVQSLLLPKL